MSDDLRERIRTALVTGHQDGFDYDEWADLVMATIAMTSTVPPPLVRDDVLFPDLAPPPPPPDARPIDPLVHFTIEAFLDLEPREVWPDGVPDDTSAEAVAAMIRDRYSSAGRWISDWNLEHEITVTVNVRGHNVEVFR